MADNALTSQSIQERVKEKIQASFVDLVPDEMWSKLVDDEWQRIKDKLVPDVVKQAATDEIRNALMGEFQKPEWQEQFAGFGPEPSEVVKKIIEESAPMLVSILFGSIVQQAVNHIRNNSIRF